MSLLFICYIYQFSFCSHFCRQFLKQFKSSHEKDCIAEPPLVGQLSRAFHFCLYSCFQSSAKSKQKSKRLIINHLQVIILSPAQYYLTSDAVSICYQLFIDIFIYANAIYGLAHGISFYPEQCLLYSPQISTPSDFFSF